MSSDNCDGILTNFRPNPKKISRRNSVGHFRRNSDETWFEQNTTILSENATIRSENATILAELASQKKFNTEIMQKLDRLMVVGIYRRIYIRRNVPTNHISSEYTDELGSSVYSDDHCPSVYSDDQCSSEYTEEHPTSELSEERCPSVDEKGTEAAAVSVSSLVTWTISICLPVGGWSKSKVYFKLASLRKISKSLLLLSTISHIKRIHETCHKQRIGCLSLTVLQQPPDRHEIHLTEKKNKKKRVHWYTDELLLLGALPLCKHGVVERVLTREVAGGAVVAAFVSVGIINEETDNDSSCFFAKVRALDRTDLPNHIYEFKYQL
ncbi:hypothetical protein YC2023_010272 [Brassica napus]